MYVSMKEMERPSFIEIVSRKKKDEVLTEASM